MESESTNITNSTNSVDAAATANEVPSNTDSSHPSTLSPEDKMKIELAKMTVQLMEARGQIAMANFEKEKIAYQYMILSIYRKYNLDNSDAINENGEIIKGVK